MPQFYKLDSDEVTLLDATSLGGKGFGLVTMIKDGLSVPPAIAYTTEMCLKYRDNPQKVMESIREELPAIKAYFVDHFGYMPLLSVRSGARVSMPGMMDTILNVGLDDNTYYEWQERLGEDCTNDSSCRLVEMYGSVVHGIERQLFEGKTLHERSSLYAEHVAEEFPTAEGQILGAIGAVFESWDNERAKVYRKMNNIPDDWGTAVVLQAMVFGNLNDKSATGVLFTRNPDSGQDQVLGEYLVQAQGEDVVAGTRTPDPISGMEKWNPEIYQELMTTVKALEFARKDVQDVEFTIQDGKLYILQTRNAKRSAKAAVRIAMEMVWSKMLSNTEGFKRVTARQFDLAQQDVIDPSHKAKPAYTGIPACSGIAKGVIVKTLKAAINCKVPFVLVTNETTPDDIGGMNASQGVLTMTGGATSHAAVVARSMDKPCVVGLGEDLSSFKEGSLITIDGASGKVWFADVPVISGADNEFVKGMLNEMWEASGCHKESFDPSSATLLSIPELPLLPLDVSLKIVKDFIDSDGDLKMLDLHGGLEPSEHSFFQPFMRVSKEGENFDLSEFLKTLQGKLTVKQRAKITVLTQQPTTLKTAASATSLEQLVLHEDGPLFYFGKTTKAVKKVLAWKFEESGLVLASRGAVTKGGYIKESLLIEHYLG